jgi:hypothetical protein
VIRWDAQDGMGDFHGIQMGQDGGAADAGLLAQISDI